MKSLQKITWNYENFFSKEIYQKELKTIFANPLFIGLENSFINNKVLVPEYLNKNFIVIKESEEYKILRNSCLHKNARLLNDPLDVKGKLIVCPIHCWAYDMHGKLVSAPYSEMNCKENDLNIKSKIESHTFRNFIINKSHEQFIKEFTSSEKVAEIDISDYNFVDYSIRKYAGNWKIYGILFHDNNHIKFMHPSMAKFINMDSLKYHYGKDFMIHTCEYKTGWENMQDNKFVKYLKERDACGLNKPSFGVIWLNIYPNFFFDIWDGYISVDAVVPISESEYEVHCYTFMHTDIINNESVKTALHEAIEEVAEEDYVICNKLYEGFKINYNQGNNYEEFITPGYEYSNIHYMQWLYDQGIYTNDFSIENVD